MVDPQPRAAHGRGQPLAAGPVALALRVDVRVVVQGRGHRGLHRRGHEQPQVPADLPHPAHQRRVAGQQARPVAGGGGLLGQRVDGEQAGVVRPRRRRGAAATAARRPSPASRSTRRRRPGRRAPGPTRPTRAARRRPARGRAGCPGEFSQTSTTPAASGGRDVGAADGQPGQHRAHLVGRVGDLGDEHRAAAGSPSSVGSSATSSLEPTVGITEGSAPSGSATVTPSRRSQPAGGRRAQRRRAQRGRVARRVAGGGQRLAEERGGVVDRRADREVDDPVGVLRGPRPRAGPASPRGSPAATRAVPADLGGVSALRPGAGEPRPAGGPC